jgi:hypothetical protein
MSGADADDADFISIQACVYRWSVHLRI